MIALWLSMTLVGCNCSTHTRIYPFFCSQVRGVAVGKQAAAVWNGKLVEMYEISQEQQVLRGIGECDRLLAYVLESCVLSASLPLSLPDAGL